MSRGLSAAAAATAASFATFDGMQTNEDLSSAQAAQVAREAGEEDEIVQEIPIVLSQELAHTLYLMQSPLRYVPRSATAPMHCSTALRCAAQRLRTTCGSPLCRCSLSACCPLFNCVLLVLCPCAPRFVSPDQSSAPSVRQ
jgi:hypothetical protein